MKKLRLIINPYTGTKKIHRHLDKITGIFSDAGYQTDIYNPLSAEDCAKYISEVADNTDLFVCCGGDGTLSNVIGGVLQCEDSKQRPIGYIPAGTCNDFASSLNIPLDVIKASHNIVEGHEAKIDVGMFNGKQFIYIASFGAFTAASYTAPQKAKNIFGHMAYIMEGMKHVNSLKPYHARFEIDGKTYEDDYIFCSISNSTRIAGIVHLNKRIVDLSDGLFEVILVKLPDTLVRLFSVLKAIQKQDLESDMITLLHTDHISFYSEEDIPWTLDGEFNKGASNIEILNLSKAVNIIINSESKK